VTENQYQELAPLAMAAQAGTLATLRGLHTAAVAREAEAARLDAQRIENERVAAELAEKKRQQDEAEAELKRKADELAAAEAALAEKSAAAALPATAESQPDTQPVGASPVAQDRVAENPVQQQTGVSHVPPADAAAEGAGVEAGGTADEAPAAASVIGNPPFEAIKPAATRAECQAVLADALALCDEMICKPPTKKQVVVLMARVAALRDRGGLPRAAS